MEFSKPFIFAGPSGVGKGTVIDELIKRHGAARAIATTTRQPRFNEVNGVDYHFTTKTEFENMIENGEFLEYATIHGNYYGSTKSSIDYAIANGKFCVIDMDVQGCRQVRKIGYDAFMIFLIPSNLTILYDRLRDRGTETETQIQQRLVTAKVELECCQESTLWDSIIVNDNFETCMNEIETFIFAQIQDKSSPDSTCTIIV